MEFTQSTLLEIPLWHMELLMAMMILCLALRRYVLGLLGAILFIMGLIGIAVGWGFWKGSGWAWIVGVIFYIVAIVISAVGMVWSLTNVIGVIIGVVILYYLFRPNVKAWFGKA